MYGLCFIFFLSPNTSLWSNTIQVDLATLSIVLNQNYESVRKSGAKQHFCFLFAKARTEKIRRRNVMGYLQKALSSLMEVCDSGIYTIFRYAGINYCLLVFIIAKFSWSLSEHTCLCWWHFRSIILELVQVVLLNFCLCDWSQWKWCQVNFS